MPVKLFSSFSEENSDLQRQIGCMTGFFQIFDRHSLLGGKKLNAHRNKRIPLPNHTANASKSEEDTVPFSPKLVQEKISAKSLSENQRMSMESSRTSFSSSSCSSFSSVDCNKSALQCPNCPDKSAKNSPSLKNLESKFLDSINKESQILSVKTSGKDEFKPPGLNYIDSPRPMHLSKSPNGSYLIEINPKLRSPAAIDESFRVLMKLKEAPWTFSETMGTKETALNHRFSYDGREITTNFLDSREIFKSTVKPKDLPRLSLDSRESSIRNSSMITKGLDRSNSYKERRFLSTNAPSVVAKLMGLEAMPPSRSNIDESINLMKNYAIKSSIDSPKISQNDFIKHCVMNPVNILKSEKTETVYSEMEKRLKELEFSHANKDLRALKQILDAIQAKGLPESKKIDQKNPAPKVASRISRDLRRKPAQTNVITAIKDYKSPIVIMKPAKYLNPSKSVGDCNGRISPKMNPKIEENIQKSSLRGELSSPKLQFSLKENNGGFEKTSNSLSPRLQQRKMEAERRIHASVTSSDSIKTQSSSTTTSPRTAMKNRSTANRQGDSSPRSESNMALKQKIPPISLKEEASITVLTTEQPSPISVLDSAFYEADLPVSMVKRSTNSSKCNNELVNSIDSEIIQKKKFGSIGVLLQKLENLHSFAGKPSSDILSSLCETQNPDHRYISEIMLASGILMKDLSIIPVSFHSSGFPINPNLYLVLEQTKSRPEMTKPVPFHSYFDTDKLRRRLIFDAVNEILLYKLDPPFLRSRKTRIPSGQHLLKELCSEIDRIHIDYSNSDGRDDDVEVLGDEIFRRDDHREEIPYIALEIERSIFKEMINEIVTGEALFSRIRSNRRRRLLFSK